MQIDIVALDAAFGILVVPHLTGFLTSPSTPGWVKSVVAIVVSLLWAALHVYLEGNFDLTNLAATISIVIIAAGVSYQTITGASSRALQSVGPINDKALG